MEERSRKTNNHSGENLQLLLQLLKKQTDDELIRK
jgi:hypothetical protein